MNEAIIKRVHNLVEFYKVVGDFECQEVGDGVTHLSFNHYKRVKVSRCNTVLKVSKVFKDANGQYMPRFLCLKLDTRESIGLNALIQQLVIECLRYGRNGYTTTYFTVKRIINELESNIERKIAIDYLLVDLG